MKITIEFVGFPNIVAAIGKKKLDLEFAGATVQDLLDALIVRYGQEVKESFYGHEGTSDLNIQIIILKGEDFLSVDKPDTPLHEGDQVMFLVMMAGG